VRLGVTLPSGRELESAAAVEARGVPFVHVAAPAGCEAQVGALVAAVTTDVRIVVSLALGDVNPVTLAEDIAVLDNLSNGRVGVIVDVGDLAVPAAVEDVSLLRAAWSGRPIRHRGRRWRVPASLPEHRAPEAVIVTPSPAQLTMPVWIAGDRAAELSGTVGLPMVVDQAADIDRSRDVAPARVQLTGDLEIDRDRVVGWAAAGATHLLCAYVAAGSGPLVDVDALDDLARWLIPEVGMVGFPRVVAGAPPPRPWPRHDAPTDT
jgi:alkanesulfonate monooxygenase SsuD/methylene tetrahydromethanopterin reductase-like flavin-dependent oxidoreductase (luciferase family)